MDKAWLYESVLSASSDHIYIYDRSGVYLYASPSGASALGLQPHDIVGKHWRELGFPSEIMERFDAHREEVFASGNPITGRASFPTLAGLRDYEYVITPIRDSRGPVAAAACAVRDVTHERTGACDETSTPFRFRLSQIPVDQAAAWATEGHLRLVADSLPMLVSYVDEQQRYRFNNRAYTDWFGVSAEEIKDRPVREVLGEVAYDQIHPYVEAALAGQFVTFSQQIAYKGGASRFVHVQYIPDRGPNGEVRGFFALVDDRHAFDSEKCFETEPSSGRRMSSDAAREISEVAVEVLHELGQPITAIASYSDAVLRVLDQSRTIADEVVEWVDAIRSQAKRAREIVRRYRAFLRGGELKRSVVNLSDLILETLNTLQPILNEQGVEVRWEGDSNLCLVSVDPVLLQQAVTNVVNNAVEAMADQAPADRLLRICIRSEVGIAKLGIADSGPGIAEEVRDRVFDPFFTTKPDGVGVGLALTRSIVTAHGGSIDLMPATGYGTCFQIVFPAFKPR